MQGPKGDTGTAQAIVVSTEFSDGTNVTVQCPANTVAIGGGVAPGNPNNTVRYTNPAGLNGNRATAWAASTAKSNGNNNGTSTAYVICSPAS